MDKQREERDNIGVSDWDSRQQTNRVKKENGGSK